MCDHRALVDIQYSLHRLLVRFHYHRACYVEEYCFQHTEVPVRSKSGFIESSAIKKKGIGLIVSKQPR